MQDAQYGVLRKTLNAEQAVAAELIQALGTPGLGQNVDLKA
ncbi:MAG: YjfB family protein [Chloroflexota bacterium]